jgi:hypothetical protein
VEAIRENFCERSASAPTAPLVSIARLFAMAAITIPGFIVIRLSKVVVHDDLQGLGVMWLHKNA